MALASHRNLFLLHRLQQSGLCLGRGAVDFVGQNDVGENGTRDKAKISLSGRAIFLDHLGARDVRGHQVRSELNAIENQIERTGQAANEQCFR